MRTFLATLMLAGIDLGTLGPSQGAGPAAQPEAPQAAIARGQDLMRNGRLAEAELAFMAATNAEPDSVVAWNLVGQARYEARNWEQALEAFERALSLAPNEAKLHANTGICQFELLRFKEASIELRRAAELDPTDGAPHLVLGRIAQEEGDLKLAEQELRRSHALEPRNPIAAYFLGVFLFKQRRYAEARAAFEQCLRLSPDMPSAHLNLGLTLLRSGHPIEGKRHVTRFKALSEVQLANDRTRMDVARRLTAARIEMDAGRLMAALSLIAEADALAPGQPAVHAFRSQIFDRQGRAEESARERKEFERLSRQSDRR